jgi:hypothetical protein
MAVINFPSSPALNDTYTFSGKTWKWNGTTWVVQASAVLGNLTINGSNAQTIAGTVTNADIQFAPSGTGKINLGSTANIKISGGTSGYVMTTDGSGTVSWQSAPAAITASYVTANAQGNITSVGTLTSLAVNGTVTAVNVTANTGVFTGNGSALTNLPAGNLSGTISSGILGNSTVYIGSTAVALNRSSASQTLTGVNIDGSASTVTTAAQGNITSVGTLTSLGVSGTVTAANVTANTGVFTGNASGLTNIPGANITGTISSGVVPTLNQNTTGYAATVSGAAQGNITSVGTLTGLTSNGTINFIGAGNVSLGDVGNLHIAGGNSGDVLTTNGANVLSWVPSGTATSAQYVTNASQGNITTTANLVSVGNIVTGTWSANIGAVSGANLTSVPAGNLTGTIPSSVLGNSTLYVGTTAVALNRPSASQSLTGISIDGSAGTVTTAAQGNITSVGTLTSLTVSGAIKPTSNAAIDLGDSTHYFGNVYGATFTGTATTAKYADVAEVYVSDKEYDPGTVVMFGGDKEITATYLYGQTAVAGVISTNPAYLMNSETTGLPVALLGRVPCKVVGPVSKGDFIVSSNMLGVGIGSKFYIPGAVIGKSLVNKDTDQVELIEVVVGRL